MLRGCAGRVIVTGMGKSGLIGRKIAATLGLDGHARVFPAPRRGRARRPRHGGARRRRAGAVELRRDRRDAGDPAAAQAARRAHRAADRQARVDPGPPVRGRPRRQRARGSVPHEPGAHRRARRRRWPLGDALAMALLELPRAAARGLRGAPSRAARWAGVRCSASPISCTPGTRCRSSRDDTTLRDVVVEMTRKRLGMTTVVDASGRLVGVITDGDLRRLHLRTGPSASSRPARWRPRTPN